MKLTNIVALLALAITAANADLGYRSNGVNTELLYDGTVFAAFPHQDGQSITLQRGQDWDDFSTARPVDWGFTVQERDEDGTLTSNQLFLRNGEIVDLGPHLLRDIIHLYPSHVDLFVTTDIAPVSAPRANPKPFERYPALESQPDLSEYGEGLDYWKGIESWHLVYKRTEVTTIDRRPDDSVSIVANSVQEFTPAGQKTVHHDWGWAVYGDTRSSLILLDGSVVGLDIAQRVDALYEVTDSAVVGRFSWVDAAGVVERSEDSFTLTRGVDPGPLPDLEVFASVTISFPASAGITYSIEVSADGDVWEPLTDVTRTADGNATVAVPRGVDVQLYRVRVARP